MAKSILSLLLVFCLVLGCSACGNNSANTGAETKKGDPFDSGWD